ncbi:MAG TPA: hypothetical protein PKY59_08590 [Pyrinomonadaceae bacterium]|nr:hypothetical protein [Pyrinomonadaceae bacterium]
MKTTRRTKLRFEKRELTVVRLSRNTRLFCADCRTEVIHLTVSQAANALGGSEINIFRLAESGEFHSIETESGQLLICAESAANFKKRGKLK